MIRAILLQNLDDSPDILSIIMESKLSDQIKNYRQGTLDGNDSFLVMRGAPHLSWTASPTMNEFANGQFGELSLLAQAVIAVSGTCWLVGCVTGMIKIWILGEAEVRRLWRLTVQ